MKLKSRFVADVVSVSIKRNKSQDGKEAVVDVDIAVAQEDAAPKWGEDFSALAFSTMRVIEADESDVDGGNHIGFLIDSVKPGKKFVFEKHRIEIEEECIEAQPELLKITPVDGASKVVARLRLPIDTGRTALISNLSAKVGQTIKLGFDPKQGSFQFVRKGESANDVVEAVQ